LNFANLVLVAGLPNWPFVGQISENWRRFKLVGLKRLVDLLSIFRPHLKLDGLKNVFGLFYAQIGSYEGTYCYSILSAAHLQTFCDECRIRRPHSDSSNI